jgi:hypothetical protein
MTPTIIEMSQTISDLKKDRDDWKKIAETNSDIIDRYRNQIKLSIGAV